MSSSDYSVEELRIEEFFGCQNNKSNMELDIDDIIEEEIDPEEYEILNTDTTTDSNIVASINSRSLNHLERIQTKEHIFMDAPVPGGSLYEKEMESPKWDIPFNGDAKRNLLGIILEKLVDIEGLCIATADVKKALKDRAWDQVKHLMHARGLLYNVNQLKAKYRELRKKGNDELLKSLKNQGGNSEGVSQKFLRNLVVTGDLATDNYLNEIVWSIKTKKKLPAVHSFVKRETLSNHSAGINSLKRVKIEENLDESELGPISVEVQQQKVSSSLRNVIILKKGKDDEILEEKRFMSTSQEIEHYKKIAAKEEGLYWKEKRTNEQERHRFEIELMKQRHALEIEQIQKRIKQKESDVD